MSKVFKEIQAGNTLYVLVKQDNKLVYEETSVISVSAPRAEMPKPNQFPSTSSFRQVVDVTYSVSGKNVTDTADVNSSVLSSVSSQNPTLVSTEKEFVLNEVRETLKQSEKILKDIDKHKKRIKDCKELIGKLDTEYNEKLQYENRLTKLEEQTNKTNDLLEKILGKMNENKLL